MTIADISLLFDMTLAVLLAVMIFYAVRLNKRIAVLRDGEGALQKMIGQFSESSLVAQESARQLKAAGTEAEYGVKAAVAKGMDDRYRVPPAPANIGSNVSANQVDERSFAPEPPRAAPSTQPSQASSSQPERFAPVSNVKPFSPPVRSADEVVRATAEAPSSAPLQARSEAERHLLDAIRAAKEGVA